MLHHAIVDATGGRFTNVVECDVPQAYPHCGFENVNFAIHVTIA
jgi:hypothetical protein